jgi:hypothetical protein
MDSKRRNILIVVFVVAAVAVAAISWYASRPTAEDDLFAPAMTKFAASESVSLRLDMETFFNPTSLLEEGRRGGGAEERSGLGSIDVPLQISGPLAFSYPRGGALTGTAELSFGAGYGLSELATLSAVISSDGQLYSKTENLPQDSGLPLDVTELNGTWFKISSQDLTRLSTVFGSKDESATNAPAVRIGADVLRTAAGGWLIPFRRYEDMQISGQPAAHYELLVDREGLSAFLAEIVGALRGRMCTAEERERIVAYVTGRRLLSEAWVAKGSGELLQLTFGSFPEGEGAGMPVALTLHFDGFNAPVQAEAPAEAETLSAVLMRVLRTPAASLGN